jgi:ubiquitin-activating enzyme E1
LGKAADRDRVATLHACWFGALPSFDGTLDPPDAGGSTQMAAGAFLRRVTRAMADGGGVYGGAAVDAAAARAFAHCVAAGHHFASPAIVRARGTQGSPQVGSPHGPPECKGTTRLESVQPVGLAPVCSFVGGVGAAEVLKALTGVFNPIEQLLFFDAAEALPPLPSHDDDPPRPAAVSAASPPKCNTEDTGPWEGAWGDFSPCGDRSDGVARLLGKAVSRDLREQRWLVVGAGAIGCELLKNLAMLGVASEDPAANGRLEGGRPVGGAKRVISGPAARPQAVTGRRRGGDGRCLVVTDMDTIERSNLNRQFLFGAADVGRFKSDAAAEAARRLNPRLRVVPLHKAVVGAAALGEECNKEGGERSQGGLSLSEDGFWASLDGVLTALDNVEARLLVDAACVRHRLPLIDAGTLGPKGNVQV